MKKSRFITSRLALGALRIRPEVMEVMQNLGNTGNHRTSESPLGNRKPEPPVSQEPPPAPSSPCRSQRRMVFVSPLPGRWIRRAFTVLGCAAMWLARPACAGDLQLAFDAANQAFAQGRSVEAARGYESVLSKQG
jgi:hypothetical protein